MLTIEKHYKKQTNENLAKLGLTEASGATSYAAANPTFCLTDTWTVTVYNDQPLTLAIDGSPAGSVIQLANVPAEEGIVACVVNTPDGKVEIFLLSKALLTDQTIDIYCTCTTSGVYQVPPKYATTVDDSRSTNTPTVIISSEVVITPEGKLAFKIRNTEVVVDLDVSSPTKVYRDPASNLLLIRNCALLSPTNIIIPVSSIETFESVHIQHAVVKIAIPLRFMGEEVTAPVKLDLDSIGRQQMNFSLPIHKLFS